jgi:AraC family transcriptional regulator
MYFTSLPDHNVPGFDVPLHFSKFGKHNIIFNAESGCSNCDYHVGCLSFKTVIAGEEWYGVGGRELAVRPGQFLILNDEQAYSSHIVKGQNTRMLSVFFKKEFAADAFRDALNNEVYLLDNPFESNGKMPEFFQTLTPIDYRLQSQITRLIAAVENLGYESCMMDEQLLFLLQHLFGLQQPEIQLAKAVNAVKTTTKKEVYKRLCIARDLLHSSYMENLDLNSLSSISCLSVPQLVRQFKAVFNTTPHQYLNRIRLQHAAELLKLTKKPVQEITWLCGFEDISAFCRIFKLAYGVPPASFRRAG